jgi:RHS repeat-associated protein
MPNPCRLPARYEEAKSGLLYHGYRYDDNRPGKFLTRDPAGFVDGPNLYTSVRQGTPTRRGLEHLPN